MGYGDAGTPITGSPPACRLTNSAVQSIATGTWTVLTFDTEAFDTNSMHSTVSNTSRITINAAGLYIVTCGINYPFNATGARALGVRKNGSGASAPTDGATIMQATAATDGNYVNYSVLAKLALNDYVEAVTFQRSGISLNSTVGDGLPLFTAVWVGLGT
jgi:hypothetical protein